MGSRHLRGWLSGIIGMWLVTLLVQPAAALEFELPGERQLEIHGFYELRLRFFGEDLPANGATLSQFRHVLNVETELDMMPEGWGPFDTMIAFTRWIVSYETIYHKGIPPLAGANSYGGHYRTPSRNPKNYPTVVTDPIFVAGTWSSPYQPGTVVPSVQNLGRAYRTCVNSDGQFGNPAGLSFLCNFFSRSMLTGPFGVHDNPPAQNDVLNRNFVQPAGVVNPLFSASLLSLARGVLGGPDVVDLFARPRAGLRLETIFAGRKPGSTFCTGNANIDPKGCSTTFDRPQNQLLAAQGFGSARLLQAAAASGRAPFADGSKNSANKLGNWAGSGSQAEAQHAGRHAPWYPLLFDSHGNQFGRTWAPDPSLPADPTNPQIFITSIDAPIPGTNTIVPKGTPTFRPVSIGAFGPIANFAMNSLGEDVHAQDLIASGQALGQPVLRNGQALYRLPESEGGGVTTDTTFNGQELPQLFQEATLESEFGPAFSLFSSDPDAYEKIGALLFARLDSDHFGNRGGEGNPSGHDGLAIINDTELTTSLWGATSFANQNPAVLTDIDAPLRPAGFLTQSSAEWISANSAFLAHNLGTAVGIRQQANGAPCGDGVPDCGVLGAEGIGEVDDQQFGNKLIPGPIGPDGLEFTDDDLPNFNFVRQTNPFDQGDANAPGDCQVIQLNSNADNPASNDCSGLEAPTLFGTTIISTGACDILGNCTPVAGFEGGGGGEVRAAWLGGAVIVNGQIEIPGQPVDLRGTRADCVPGSDDPDDIAACQFGACNVPEFGVEQPATCRFNPDRFVQALEAVQCARINPSLPTGPGNFDCGGKREVITADIEAIETWKALSQTEKEEQCQSLAVNANKRFFFGGAGISGANPTGLNSKGICVELQFNRSLGIGAAFPGISSVQAAGLAGFFSNKAGRPLGAFELPTDLTQIAALLQQTTRPPGRPAYAYSTAQGATGDSPNGLFFMTAGQDKFVKEHNQVYSNLDLDFRESELIWEHGASQDTKEFREGYIEFELLDSALFARVGKLLVVWGKTELVRNQDRLNPVDIGFGTFSALEESRIGQWATQVIYSPEWAMQLGPFEDLRFEGVMIWGQFEPQDLGKCGESLTFVQVCQKSFGALANGVLGLGLVGEARPSDDYDGWAKYDYGLRIEGRWDRFTFSISDFWGWDDTFYIEPIQTYARRADPSTGAPVNINGPRECKIRTKICDPDTMQCHASVRGRPIPVGPDNVANPCVFSNNTPLCPTSNTPGLYNGDLPFEDQATPEDRVASIGNCLLFDNPTSANARQSLRNAAEISLNHYANLNLFHVICTLQFSPDAGFCGFDQLNTPQTWNFIAGALATGQLTTLISPDSQTYRTQSTPFAGFPLNVYRELVFANSDGNENDFSPSTAGAGLQGLLGCGPHFLSFCDTADGQSEALLDFAYTCTSGVPLLNPIACDPSTFTKNGNPINLNPINSDPTKGLLDPNAINPVDRFGLPSIQPEAVRAIGGIDFLNADASVLMQEFSLMKAQEAGAYIGTALGDCPPDREFDGQCFLPGISLPDPEGGVAPTDFVIEGMTFPINEAWAERGILVFKTEPEDRLDGGVAGSVAGIENCTPFTDAQITGPGKGGGKPDGGCSLLENLSANLERLLIQLEQAGSDRVFDPPESFVELMRMLDGIASNDIQGDPFSGPDGLLSLNLDIKVPVASGPLDTLDTWLFIPSREVLDEPNGIYNGQRDRIKDTYVVGMNTPSTRLRVPEGFDAPLTLEGPDLSVPVPQIDIEIPDPGFVPPGPCDPFEDGGFSFDTPSCLRERLCDSLAPGSQASIDEGCSAALIPDQIDDPNFVRPIIDLPANGCQAPLPGSETFLGYCFQYVAAPGISDFTAAGIPLIAAMPINLNVCPLESGCDDGNDNMGIDPALLTAEQLIALDRGEVVRLSAEQNPIKTGDGSGEIVIRDGISCNTDQTGNNQVCAQDVSNNVKGLRLLDSNNDAILDLDQDGDGTLDFLDDGTAGPVSDDNVLCGSGLPGDVLQDALQFEFIFEQADLALLKERFPDGIETSPGNTQWLPPRSPIFCGSLVGLMSATGRTYPFKEAGGNGAFGRRSFQWHGGSQLGIFYQKRNVFGLGLDFAEDTTKSSWGLEFSWAKDSVVSNVAEPLGYNFSDEYVLTVSVDRPTFINFLNPNRTFFINFQFFLNWLATYDEDENFAARPHQLDGLVSLTFFTGYFQDRLNPRVTAIWFPMNGTYGMLTGVGYRWNERFSTSLGLNYFWGRRNMARGNYFQFLRTTPYEKSEVFRGTGAVQNRDVATMTFRYTW